MIRKGLLVMMLALAPGLVLAQLSVGIMNPDEVMQSLPETEEVQQELDLYGQELEEEFVNRYSAWMDEVNAYEEQVESGSLSGEEQSALEEQLMDEEEELGNLERRIQNQLQQRQAELIEPIMQRVEQAMQEAAMEHDLDFVLNRQTSSGDPLIYYASDRSVDITEEVIERLTSN
ncbi:MAG: OmpH family outer membrane protein [Bacteroidota bacterium]